MIRIALFAAVAAPQICLAQQGTVEEGRQLYLDGAYEAGLAILRPFAEAGDPIAQNILGVAYENGAGVEVDGDAAMDWYGRAADAGLARAIYNIGHAHLDGDPSIPDDPAVALDHLERAAALGYAPAMSEAGRFCELGLGGESDLEAAAGWYRKAHEAGYTMGTSNYALLLRTGRGVPEDDAKARQLLARAAAEGDLPAMHALGYMLTEGEGGAADPDGALVLLRLAADRGRAAAAVDLAWLHADEALGHFDPVAAAAWCLWAEREAEDADEAMDNQADCSGIAEWVSDAEAAAALERLATMPPATRGPRRAATPAPE